MAALWHAMGPDEVAARLKSSEQRGINPEEARRRLGAYGPNELTRPPVRSRLAMFFGQFDDFMVLILLGATAVSALMGEMADAIVIVSIVILNALLGYLQESRAERSLEALRELAAPTARVVRAGGQRTIPATEVVPGDLLILSQGDRVPADCRLCWSSNLEIDESAVTGESFAVRKQYRPVLSADTALGDRVNMAHAGTVVTRGMGRGISVATGMNTEVGQIAQSMNQITHEDTPLQRRLDRLGRVLVLCCLAVCAVVGVSGVLRGEPIYKMILVGVSLAVAAIPEGLPAVVTIALALGVQRMIQKNAIVRRLPAVETLGCATVICSDKTGTITRNEMTVRAIVTPSGEYRVTGSGYSPVGEIEQAGRPVQVGSDLRSLVTAVVLCNNAWIDTTTANKGAITWEGDPTEVALLVLGLKAGFRRDTLANEHPRLAELPFESERRCMSVVTGWDGMLYAYVKGAPDVVMGMCTKVLYKGVEVPLSSKSRQELLLSSERMAGDALRVLAVARRKVSEVKDDPDPKDIEADLTFLGLVGMIDPPRPEVRLAVERCKRAGLRTVMITGDHRNTAEAIAREAGMFSDGEISLTGQELDAIDEQSLTKQIDRISVFARVSPKHKLRIVRALRARGEVVAMTGDGVNDAPAVKEADIGVAMGISGTDVTREASAMVLADDNFATIVSAVEEGRAIYENIRKFIRYLLSCNVGEVLIMFLASILGYPVPLVPIQMLWVNLVTDGLPAVALGIDPPRRDLMAEPPRSQRESVFSRGLGARVLARGSLIGVGSFVMFVASYEGTGDVAHARTVALVTLVMFQLFHVFDCRTEQGSVFDIGFLSNRLIVAAVVCSLLMVAVVVYTPALSKSFNTLPLGAKDWLAIILVSGMTTIFQGIRFVLFRR